MLGHVRTVTIRLETVKHIRFCKYAVNYTGARSE